MRRRMVLVVSLFVLSIGVLAAPPAFASDPTDTPPPDLVYSTGETCATAYLFVGLYLPPGVTEKSVEVTTSNDDTCSMTAGPIVTVGTPGVEPGTDQTDLELDGPAATTTDPSASTTTGSCGSARSNWIHTSHTLQDGFRIDLAWLRTSYKRLWGCNTTWWSEIVQRVRSRAGSGPSWWHHQRPDIVDQAVDWYCRPPGVCQHAKAPVVGEFHTDFVHCNFINQDIRMRTVVVTYRNGGKYVDFQQNGNCPGVVSATAVKVNDLMGGGYGGDDATDLWDFGHPYWYL